MPSTAGKRAEAVGTPGPVREVPVPSLLEPTRPLRREDGREVPLGSRGAATRQRLLEAARAVFEEQGYGQSSVSQISERAGVSQGTYYQYFRDRAHVMSALVDDYVAGLLGDAEMVWHIDQGRDGLRRLMNTYVAHYATNAAFARVWEEVSQIEPALADVRRHLTHIIEKSIEDQLAKGVKARLIPRLPDPAATARALTSMADRYCYLTYAFDPATPPAPPASTAKVLVDMWSRALQLP